MQEDGEERTSMNGACEKTAPSRGQCVRRSTGDVQRYAHKWQWRLTAPGGGERRAATECTRRRALHGG